MADNLKILQQHEFQILLELRKLCEKHGLKYYITAGTLLGAVRHGGFIPWDDDIDVIMPRKDFKKLRHACKESLPDKYFCQCRKNDKNYPFMFVKIRENDTFVDDPFLKNVDIHKGLYIDIFPVDKCPVKDRNASRFFTLTGIASYSLIAKCDKDFVPQNMDKGLSGFLFKFFKTMPAFFAYAFRGAVVGFVNVFSSGKKLCTVSGAHGYPYEAYDKEWFDETAEVIFCNEKFPAPSGYDKLLTNMYGDYMTPPDENERTRHFDNTEV